MASDLSPFIYRSDVLESAALSVCASILEESRRSALFYRLALNRPTNRRLSHHQLGRDKNALRCLLRLGRELQGKLPGNASKLCRSVIDGTQGHPQVVGVAKVPATDKRDVFRHSQSCLQCCIDRANRRQI